MIDIRRRITDFFTKELWEIDASSLNKYKAFAVKALRLLNVAFHEFTEGQLTLRAMSLVYSILLSIVPVLAISVSVLKAFGVHNQVEPYLSDFLAPLGSKGQDITERIVGFIENMKVGVLGSLGLVMLIYTVISVIQKLEKTFNYIWRVKRARSFVRQLSDYMSVILIGPVIVFSAVGITASFMSTSVMTYITNIEPFGTLIYYSIEAIPFILICGVFTFLYIFIPNTKVNFTSALFGGVLAGILWQGAGWGFASFVASSAKYAAIYSGFAILILFLIWLYLSWLILLVGAQISFYHQYPQFLHVKSQSMYFNSRIRERVAFIIMYLIGDHFFNNRKPWTLNALVEHLNLPVDGVHDVIMLLEKNELILETGDDPPAYMPARDIGKITLKEIYNTVRIPEYEAVSAELRIIHVPQVENIINKLDSAYGEALSNRTLKDIVTAG